MSLERYVHSHTRLHSCFTSALALFIGSVALVPSVFAQQEQSTKTEAGDSTKAEATIESIESLVSDAVANDALLKRQQLTATSRNGIVTLSGQADSLTAKRRASDVAKHVRGVRSVVNQILVKHHGLDDETVAACVRRALTVDPVTEKAEIATTVDAGEVGLAGSVSSLTEKQIAERVVGDVLGVTNVVNQLTVKLEKRRSDIELQPEIQRLIDNAVLLGDSKIDVAVEQGKVTLSGTVDSAWQQDKLLFLAGVRGVSMVTLDNVAVRGDTDNFRSERATDRDDQSIQKTIQLAFHSDPLVLSFTDDIEVKVDQGLVTLTGSVSRVRAKRAAESIAKNTVGVRSVNNQLKVAWNDDKVSDDDIIREAQAAIKRSPYLERHEIRVHCHDCAFASVRHR